LVEGKTKRLHTVIEDPNLVWVVSKPDITAFDDPKFTKVLPAKAVCATTVACRVFELLAKRGIPVAYRGQLSETEFVMDKCEMLPLEVVARRYVPEKSSYKKRHPECIGNGIIPFRFTMPVVEFYLKTTGGQLVYKEKVIVEGLDPKAGEEDPLMQMRGMYDFAYLCHSKKLLKEGYLRKCVHLAQIELVEADIKYLISKMFQIIRILEQAWSILGYRLIDLKVEFGRNSQGKIVVADVIDNDSWRLCDADWQELSKQLFRDGAPLPEVEKAYRQVADLANRLY